MMIILALIVTFALLIIALTTVLNALTFTRLALPAQPAQTEPLVSILIPARNEAAVIAETVTRLLRQSYSNVELLLLDDHSTDGTAQVAQQAAHMDDRLRVLQGAALPPGWLGKNWACHQLAQAAQGDILLFTDADTRWEPAGLTALMALQTRTQADLVTVWPTQTTLTWGERLVVPMMALAIIGYLPGILVNRTRWTAFAAAMGQCMSFRRTAYHAVGGHQALKAEIVEDVAFARRIKQHRLRLWAADGNGLIGCRMYTDWSTVRNGYAKNILRGHGDSVLFLALSAVFHWSAFVLPWIGLLFGGIDRLWAVTLVGLSLGIRALTAAVTRQRIADALLMPVSVLLMTIIAVQAVYWRWRFGGPQWKGRTIAAADQPQEGVQRL
jgi:chlorobactene glucosyltransferase